MSSYPKDRFDDLPADLDRRGAHRAPRTRAAKLASWLWGLGAIAVIVLLGVLGMSIIDSVVTPNRNDTSSSSETPAGAPPSTESAAAAAQPRLDPNARVTVLNGTGGTGVASSGMQKLTAAGWNVVSSGDAESFNHPTTLIVYGDPADEPAALQIARDLGGGAPTLDPAQTAKGELVVTIGQDLAG